MFTLGIGGSALTSVATVAIASLTEERRSKNGLKTWRSAVLR